MKISIFKELFITTTTKSINKILLNTVVLMLFIQLNSFISNKQKIPNIRSSLISIHFTKVEFEVSHCLENESDCDIMSFSN